MTVLVDLLYVAGCPNVALARRRLLEAISRSGVGVAVREREITDPGEAEASGLRGSPTILVEGQDAVGGEATASMSCRLYLTDTGVDGAPTVGELLKALVP